MATRLSVRELREIVSKSLENHSLNEYGETADEIKVLGDFYTLAKTCRGSSNSLVQSAIFRTEIEKEMSSASFEMEERDEPEQVYQEILAEICQLDLFSEVVQMWVFRELEKQAKKFDLEITLK